MNAPGADLTDAAWVVIDTPLTPEDLAAFCSDVERLFRINPLLELAAWQATRPGRARVRFRNLSNNREVDVDVEIARSGENTLALRYGSGLKRETRIEIEPAPCGSRLTITDDYSGTDAREATARSSEVDRSLSAWGAALHAYLRREKRWGRYAPWRWFMRRIWLPMRPAGRRVTYILLVITVVEIAAIALAIVIYRLAAL